MNSALILIRLYIHMMAFSMALALPPASSFAGHPMATDDAGIVAAKACQLETWTDRVSGSAKYWLLPACNVTNNLELTIGGAWTYKGGNTKNTQVVFQMKTIFTPLESNEWGLGLAAGAQWHAEPREQRTHKLYAYLPASFAFHNGKVIVHANLGWSRESADRSNHLEWGLAAEAEALKPLSLFVEVFGQERGHPSFQFGLWYWILAERFRVNAAYGNRFGTPSGGHLLSIGVTVFSAPFLP